MKIKEYKKKFTGYSHEADIYVVEETEGSEKILEALDALAGKLKVLKTREFKISANYDNNFFSNMEIVVPHCLLSHGTEIEEVQHILEDCALIINTLSKKPQIFVEFDKKDIVVTG